MTAGTALSIDVEATWGALRYAPNRAQAKVHASGARNRVNAAGRRTGKSTAAGHELVIGALEAYANQNVLDDLGIRHEEWIVGPNYTDSEKEFRVFYNDCRRVGMPFDKPGTYYTKQDMTVSLWGGRFIVSAKSGAHPETLVGEGLHRVHMAEAAKMKESVWERFVRPMLADFEGESLWNSTPEGKNWFYDIWQAGLDTRRPDWQSWRHPSWVNRRVFRKRTTRAGVDQLLELIESGAYDPIEHLPSLEVDPEIAAMAVDLTTAAFEQEVACSFVQMAGRVFKNWDQEVHVADLPYNPSWPLYIATDYGYTHPNVALFIQRGPFGDVHVIAEYYRTHRTDQEFAEDVMNDHRLKFLVPQAKGLYPDPEDPSATRTLSERWKVPSVGGTGGLLKDRLEAIELALRVRNRHLPYGHSERVPLLRVDRSCINMIREMDAYSWPEKRKDGKGLPKKDHPKDEDNHCPEALGRWFAGHIGLGGGPSMSTVTMGRRGSIAANQRRKP